MRIVFQNNDFIAVDKESGWLTTPARTGELDPRPVLGLEIQRVQKKQVYPVHRLDFEVSGLVLFALSAQAHSAANSLFESRKVRKTYQALTENPQSVGLEPGSQFEWKAKVLRGKKRAFESPHGKISHTLATFIGMDENAHLRWELVPVTGRAHQLRFDLARHGFPICGDGLYGARETQSEPPLKSEKISLRAVTLEFADAAFCERWQLPTSLQVLKLF